MFSGFSQDAVDFLWGIRFHNEKSWFEAHKEIYLSQIIQPMRALGEQVYQSIQTTHPELGLTLHVSRIYRDARRLHGRGPYKDHIWFTLRKPKDSIRTQPVFYFEIAPEYYSYGMGCYDATPSFMEAFRRRIDQNPKPLEKLARHLSNSEFQLDGDCYKRPKKAVEGVLKDWYNRKRIALIHDENCEGLLFQPELSQKVIQGFEFLVPYYLYLYSVSADELLL